MNEVQHPGFDKSEKYETFTTTNGLKEAAEHYASVTDPEAHGVDFIREVFISGAEYAMEQIMKDAVEGIARPDDCEIWVNLTGTDIKDGDKVIVQVRKKGT